MGSENVVGNAACVGGGSMTSTGGDALNAEIMECMQACPVLMEASSDQTEGAMAACKMLEPILACTEKNAEVCKGYMDMMTQASGGMDMKTMCAMVQGGPGAAMPDMSGADMEACLAACPVMKKLENADMEKMCPEVPAIADCGSKNQQECMPLKTSVGLLMEMCGLGDGHDGHDHDDHDEHGDADMMKLAVPCIAKCPTLATMFAIEGPMTKDDCGTAQTTVTCVVENMAGDCAAVAGMLAQDTDTVSELKKTCDIDIMAAAAGGGEATPTEPGATTVTTTTTATKVEVSFTVKGVALDELSDDDKTTMKGNFAKSVAETAGVSEDKVTVALMAGSIVVKSTIDVDDPSQATALTETLAKPEAAEAMTATAKASPVLKKALEAKGKTIDDLEVTAPTATTVTVTMAPSPASSPSAATTTAGPTGGDASLAETVKAVPVLAMVAASIALFA